MITDIQERDRRWSRVRAGMAERGIDCLILVGNTGLNSYHLANVAYLTGMQREGMLLFPQSGDPVLLSFGGGQPTDGSWIDDHRNGYPTYADKIIDIIADRGWQGVRFGAVLSGYEGDQSFPAVLAAAIADRYPSAELVDATDVMVLARRVKSAAEIAYLEEGCRIGLQAMQAVAAMARPGVDDAHVKAELIASLFRGGSMTNSLLLFHSGASSVHGAMGGSVPSPIGRMLELGDVMNVEFDSAYEGYRAQFNQPFFIGDVGPEWDAVVATAAEAFQVGVDTMRPGVTARELQEAMRAPVAAAGYLSLGPMYHGIGLSIEPPVAQTGLGTSLIEDLDVVLEPGMVLELEPHVVAKDMQRGSSLGSPVLVTEDGARLLAPDWRPDAVRIPVN